MIHVFDGNIEDETNAPIAKFGGFWTSRENPVG